MNWKIVSGAGLILIGIVDLFLYLTGYRDNTLIPKPFGAAIPILGGIYLIVLGKREKK